MKTPVKSTIFLILTAFCSLSFAAEERPAKAGSSQRSLLLPAVQMALVEHSGELDILRHEFGDAAGIRMFLSIFTDGFESGDTAAIVGYKTIRWHIESGIADFTSEQWFALWSDEKFMASCSEETRYLIDEIIVILINELVINLSRNLG